MRHGQDESNWFRRYLLLTPRPSLLVVSLASFDTHSIHSAHYSAIPRQIVDQLISWRERSGVTIRMVIVIRESAAVIGSNFICYQPNPCRVQ